MLNLFFSKANTDINFFNENILYSFLIFLCLLLGNKDKSFIFLMLATLVRDL